MKMTNMDKIKATLRIPTTEQYAYIEVVVEDTPLGIKETYNKLTKVMRDKETDDVTPEDFYQFLQILIDSDLNIWGTADDYEVLASNQKKVMQSLKRFKKRLQGKVIA